MGKSKKEKGASKKAAKKALQDAEKARNKAIASANKSNKPVEDAVAPELLSFREGLVMSSCKASALESGVQEQVFELFKGNMEAIYRENWGWKPTEKMAELTHSTSRMLMVYSTQSTAADADGGSAATDDGAASEATSTDASAAEETEAPVAVRAPPSAFAHFRFEVDDEDEPTEAVLYVYELQLSEPVRRQGLGQHMMMVLEATARHVGLSKVMLTVFKTNTAAMDFYLRKMGYTIDPTSPSLCGQKAQYEILSKLVPDGALERLQQHRTRAADLPAPVSPTSDADTAGEDQPASATTPTKSKIVEEPQTSPDGVASPEVTA